jgi:limonene-1,2-epoxide hydrolase
MTERVDHFCQSGGVVAHRWMAVFGLDSEQLVTTWRDRIDHVEPACAALVATRQG